MSQTFQIVKLRPDQWKLYRQIRLEALQTDPQAFGSRYEDMIQQPDSFWQGRLLDAQEGQKNWLLFARGSAGLAGMIGAVTTEDPTVVKIIAVYVRPDFRGRGIGSLLMHAILVVVGKQKAFQKAVLGVNSVQTAAVGLYHRFGFEVVGEEVETSPDGEIRRGFLMEKVLTQV